MAAFSQKMVAVIKTDNKVLREDQNGLVQLPFGSYYSINLKNLNNKNAFIKISIDGSDILDNHELLIKKYGQKNSEMEISRFIRNGNLATGPKLKFIEKTEKISNFRGDNIEDGIIRISWKYEEEFQPNITYTYTSNTGDNAFIYLPNTTCNSESVYANYISDRGITIGGENINQQFTIDNQYRIKSNEEYIICFYLKGYNASGDKIEKPKTTKDKIRCLVCGTLSKSIVKFCPECGNNLG